MGSFHVKTPRSAEGQTPGLGEGEWRRCLSVAGEISTRNNLKPQFDRIIW
jgi:hypothetical protein